MIEQNLLLRPSNTNHAKLQTVFHKPHRPQFIRISLSCLRTESLEPPALSYPVLLHSLEDIMSSLREQCSRSLSSKVAPRRPEPRLSPESLPLHDVPQLAQVGLSNDIVRFELQCTQVVGLCFGKFPIQVKNGAKIHQSSWVLWKRRETGSEQ